MKIVTFAVLCFALLIAQPCRAAAVQDSYGGRNMILYVPSVMPGAGARALVIVMHGGMGSAEHVAGKSAESAMNMDEVAEKGGFIVAYLNGTKVARMMSDKRKGWNAGGGCCGMPFQNNVDDAGYITGAVDYLARKYGIDRTRVFGIGHSNGGLMAQRVVCETNVFAAIVPISGPLGLHINNCPGARGKRILAIHGAEDQNVPVNGGKGTKGIAGVDFQSEAYSEQVMTASGASYTLDIVPGADHYLNHIDDAVRKTEGMSLSVKAARFFGLIR